MTIDLTLQGLTYVFVLVGGMVGVWWRLQRCVASVSRDLQNYKLEVAKEYASVSHLMEVEERLVKSIDRLTDRIEEALRSVNTKSQIK